MTERPLPVAERPAVRRAAARLIRVDRGSFTAMLLLNALAAAAGLVGPWLLGRDADRVALMAEGRLTEIGTHDELVSLGGAYAALWRSWHGDRP
ncbi:hypothetical protein [Streptomyces sp. PT12]|uniref:hypothetical protein n=1 Tax=Streptomyces sp. PT12 TaxID=1510197 RepID=UPI000DE2A55D|nr:hypothetical protein [Streptomyces sp. PT12]RBM16148.1 hypothetical protein DEH69_17280 [Streptomyces sp. PT12]